MPISQQRREFGPSMSRYALHFGLGLTFTFIGIFLLTGKSTDANPLWGLASLLMGTLLLAIRINDALKRQPRIILTPEGIEFRATRQNSFHAWSEVGVFAVRTQRVRYNTFRYICAYSDINHDALNTEADKTTVGLYDADISFQITDMKVGRTEELASQLVDELNTWRTKYGAPENNARHLTEQQIDTLKTKKRRKVLIIGLSLFLLPFLVYGVIYYMGW